MANLREIYYLLKPVIPRRIQIALRRKRAQIIVRRHDATWPVDPKCGTPPVDWRGWPAEKKFCVVLSHDVDTQLGHDRVLKLLKIEQSMGFASAFNFVPERYNLSVDLIRQVQQEGFGVAVHGLKHDGKLFSSLEIFTKRSKKINQYIKDWKTRGFTAPAMIHNLGWMHMLDIEYATTTFDTDPIEPQPEGAGTIFPYWVKELCRGYSYVELPYTLPQDFTLFIILKEKTINIWKDKLDWVADQGGMVLLNTHPDYMKFGNGKIGLEEYPVEYYTRLLEYIRTKYKNQYWMATPQQVSDYMRKIYTSDSMYLDVSNECQSRISKNS